MDDPKDDALVEYSWSSAYGRMYPLYQPALVEKAITTATWRASVCRMRFLADPPKYNDIKISPMTRVWFCNALLSLTRNEMIKLYDTLIASHKACWETGGDFTPKIVRDRLPHLYSFYGE